MGEYELTKEKILAMSKECPELETAFKKAYPDAFEEKWSEVTGEVRWRQEYDCGCWFLRCYHNNGHIFTIPKNGPGGGAYAPDERYKIDFSNHTHRIFIKE